MTSWYITVNSKAPEQGDFLNDVPIIVTEEHLVDINQKATPSIDTFDVIVLTQSCDLINNNKVSQVQLAPVYTLKELIARYPKWNDIDKLNNMRRNNVVRYHLLNNNHSSMFVKRGYLVIDFGNIRSIPVKTLFALCGKQRRRLRLNSPYLEQMSQQLARFYMRVGLPNDIPNFKHKLIL